MAHSHSICHTKVATRVVEIAAFNREKTVLLVKAPPLLALRLPHSLTGLSQMARASCGESAFLRHNKRLPK